METIIIMALVGFLLVLAEMFLPGIILGVLGAILLIAAVIMGYTKFGPATGTVIFCIVVFITLAGFIVWMNVFPSTAMGRRITLGQSLQRGDDLPQPGALVGAEGVALTPLRPAGKALVNGARLDVLAESAFINPGEAVSVIAAEGTRVVVRKKA
jgi:membrane-bound ClpP family serine protease